MSEIITCPSGLKGSIRAMLVREERILADRKLAKAGGQVDELLAACWEETLEAGPYDFGDKVIDWGKVLQGDRFFALLKIRALTYGVKYAFSVPCQNDACRHGSKQGRDRQQRAVTHHLEQELPGGRNGRLPTACGAMLCFCPAATTVWHTPLASLGILRNAKVPPGPPREKGGAAGNTAGSQCHAEGFADWLHDST